MMKGVPTKVYALDPKRPRKVVFVKVIITKMRRRSQESVQADSAAESRRMHHEFWAIIDAQLNTSTPL